MRYLKLLFAGLCLSVAACGVFSSDDDDKKSSSIEKADGKGCVQGVVLDGLTGKRLPLSNADKDYGVQTLVRNRLISAKSLVDGEREDANERLKGEYFICGIPLDNEFPIFAWHKGYQDFEGAVLIPSTIAHRSPQAQTGDIALEYPTVVANIYLFPKGTESNDLSVQVIHDGRPVKGAKVQLTASGSNTIGYNNSDAVLGQPVARGPIDDAEEAAHGVSGFTVRPQIRIVPEIAVTGDDGRVTISGKNLVLGGVYNYVVFPPEGGRDMTVVKGAVSVGYRLSDDFTSMPYNLVVKLGESQIRLAESGRSTDVTPFHESGELTVWFNQEIELVPNVDSFVATVNNGAKDCKANLYGSNDKRSLGVKIQGNRLTLTPNWRTIPNKQNLQGCIVTYRGVQVRAKGSFDANEYLTIGGSVSLTDRR